MDEFETRAIKFFKRAYELLVDYPEGSEQKKLADKLFTAYSHLWDGEN